MYAIGSSYLIQQSPGAERFGGLTLKLWPNHSGSPSRNILLSSWTEAQTIREDIRFLTSMAEEGIKQFAAEQQIDLSNYNWELSRFAYHPIDSKPEVFRLAGYNAFASAWATWHSSTTSRVE